MAILGCLHRPKDRGNLETAQRVREALQHVYQYAVDVGALEPAKNFVNKDTGGLPPPRSRHFAADAILSPDRLAIPGPGKSPAAMRDSCWIGSRPRCG